MVERAKALDPIATFEEPVKFTLPASDPMYILSIPVVIAAPLDSPNVVFPCGLPTNPAGTVPTYRDSVSTKASVRLFKLVAAVWGIQLVPVAVELSTCPAPPAAPDVS